MPQRKGEIEVPSTGSWLIARISSLVRILSVSSVIADSWERSVELKVRVSLMWECSRSCQSRRSVKARHCVVRGEFTNKGDFIKAQAVKCDFASSNVRFPFPS